MVLACKAWQCSGFGRTDMKDAAGLGGMTRQMGALLVSSLTSPQTGMNSAGWLSQGFSALALYPEKL